MVRERPLDEEIPVPPWRTPPRRAAPAREPLSRAAVVAAALRILDAEGLDAVSMRRVAHELGTGPASLYAHVGNKEELLELVLDEIIGEIPLPAPEPGRWREQVREIAYASRDVLAAHRDVARVALANVPLGPNSLRLTEAMLGVLRGAGIPDQLAAWTVDRLSSYITSDALEEATHRSLGRESEADAHEYYDGVRAYLASLPADRFPHIASMAATLTEGGGDERFEFGLSCFLDGLAAHSHLPGR